MRKILNLTQHNTSEEQKKAGVFEPAEKEKIRDLLTFSEIPDREEIRMRAYRITKLARKELGKEIEQARKEDCLYPQAMIGGAPFLMGTLEFYLRKESIEPVYAFTKREVIEEREKKISLFKHMGFVHPLKIWMG